MSALASAARNRAEIARARTAESLVMMLCTSDAADKKDKKTREKIMIQCVEMKIRKKYLFPHIVVLHDYDLSLTSCTRTLTSDGCCLARTSCSLTRKILFNGPSNQNSS